MALPAISDERVIIEGPASIRIKLKSAWADGTHSLLFTPSEFLERLAALIPVPKFHTTRYYGVLASRSPHRRYLLDKPTPLIDTELGVDGQDEVAPFPWTKCRLMPWTREACGCGDGPAHHRNHIACIGTSCTGNSHCTSPLPLTSRQLS